MQALLKKARKALFLKQNYSAKDFWKESECLIEQRMCLLYDTLKKNNAGARVIALEGRAFALHTVKPSLILSIQYGNSLQQSPQASSRGVKKVSGWRFLRERRGSTGSQWFLGATVWSTDFTESKRGSGKNHRVWFKDHCGCWREHREEGSRTTTVEWVVDRFLSSRAQGWPVSVSRVGAGSGGSCTYPVSPLRSQWAAHSGPWCPGESHDGCGDEPIPA